MGDIELQKMDKETIPLTMEEVTKEHYRELEKTLESGDLKNFESVLDVKNIDPDHFYDEHELTILELACRKDGAIEFVKKLISHGANVNKFNRYRQKYPIFEAISKENEDVVEYLLNQTGLDVDCTTLYQVTPVHFAVIKLLKRIKKDSAVDYSKSMKILEMFLRKGANVNIPNDEGFTPFHTVVASDIRNDLKNIIVKTIIDNAKMNIDVETTMDCHGPDVKKARKYLKTQQCTFGIDKNVIVYVLLSYLFRRREEDFLELLERIKADESKLNTILNFKKGSFTLLQLACAKNLENTVKTLIGYKAEPNAMAVNSTKTPLGHACNGGYYKIVRFLVGLENIYLGPSEGRSLLQLTVNGECSSKKSSRACKEIDHEKCLNILLKKPEVISEIDYKSKDGNTALHYAARKSNPEIVLKLLKNGAYLNLKNNLGETPMEYMSQATFEAYLDECINVDENKEAMNNDNYDKITFNYSFIFPNRKSQDNNEIECSNEMDIFEHMSQSQSMRNLLKHPLIVSFLYIKWAEIKNLFICNVALYLSFWLSMMVYILLITYEIDNFSVILSFRILTGIFLALLIIREVTQAIVFRRSYCNLENVLELLVIVITIFGLIFDFYPLFVTIIILSTVDLILFVGKFPKLSKYVEMLKTVSWNFAKFLVWCFVLMLAFAISFFVLLQKGKPEEGKVNMFSNLGTSIFKTIVMLTSELDASDIAFEEFPGFSHVVFVLFVFMVPIVLFNLLTALAISDIQAIRENAELLSLISMIRTLSRVEDFLVKFPKSRIFRKIIDNCLGGFTLCQRLVHQQYKIDINLKNNTAKKKKKRMKEIGSDLIKIDADVVKLANRTIMKRESENNISIDDIDDLRNDIFEKFDKLDSMLQRLINGTDN